MRTQTFVAVLPACFTLAAGLHSLQAQASIGLVGSGYAAPAPPAVAPGQLVSLFFRGVPLHPDGGLRSGRAESIPLPASMAGLSIRLNQDGRTLPVPILSVKQEDDCEVSTGMSPVCALTSVRVQVPYEVSAATESLAEMVLIVDGQSSRIFPVQPVAVNAHVLTACDVPWDVRWSSVCSRSAYHADGRSVNESAPAHRGEMVVVYANGLGATWPPAITGGRSPGDARIPESGFRRVWAVFRNSPLNASGSVARYVDAEALASSSASSVRFAGLTPGEVGLYQLNVEVPASFQPVLPCGGDIQSNAVLLITTGLGSEPVPLCVQ